MKRAHQQRKVSVHALFSQKTKLTLLIGLLIDQPLSSKHNDLNKFRFSDPFRSVSSDSIPAKSVLRWPHRDTENPELVTTP